jgi:hypothetical protein
MKKLIILLLSAVLVGCSSIRISYDFDKQADFSKYKTYSFSESINEMGVSDLNRDRIIKAIETQMTAKGFTMQENPDVVIDVHIKAQQKVSATATTSGMGYGYPWRYGYGGGFTTTQVNYNEYTEGTLFINMVDMSTEKIVWQGIGTKTINENASPQKREETANYAVQQIFTKYPPQ